MPSKKTRISTVPVPNNVHEAAEVQRRIGELLRTINAKEEHYEAKHLAIDQEEAAVIEPLQSEALELAQSVFIFAQAHKAELTDEGKRKMVALPRKAGSVKWYKTAPATVIENASEVLERIKKLGLTKFIRQKEEINREALLEDQEKARSIEGISISQQEKFVIMPRGTKHRVERTVSRRPWKIVRPDV